MSSTTNPRVQLIDSDGDALDNGSGKLVVTGTINTELGYGETIIVTYGEVTASETASTLVTLGISEVNIVKELTVQADHDNSTFIMVGGSGVAATGTLNGFKLYGGDIITFKIKSTSYIWVDAPAAGQKLRVGIIT